MSHRRIARGPVEQYAYRMSLRRAIPGRGYAYAWCDVLASDELGAIRKAEGALGYGWNVTWGPIPIPHVGSQLHGTHPMRLLGNGVWRGLPIE